MSEPTEWEKTDLGYRHTTGMTLRQHFKDDKWGWMVEFCHWGGMHIDGKKAEAMEKACEWMAGRCATAAKECGYFARLDG